MAFHLGDGTRQDVLSVASQSFTKGVSAMEHDAGAFGTVLS